MAEAQLGVAPSGATDAATKGYVDTTAGNATPAASTLARWDANLNLSANSVLEGFTSTATAGSTTTLSITSTETQVFTGTNTQVVVLPSTSVPAGLQYLIINNSTAAVTVQASSSNNIVVVMPGTWVVVTALVATPTTPANWNAQYNLSGQQLAASAGTMAAQTAVTTVALLAKVAVPANTLAVGNSFKFRAFGAASVASTITFTLRYGTTGTTADTAIFSPAPVFGAAGNGYIDGLLTVRSTGGSGTIIGNAFSTAGTTVAVTNTTSASTIATNTYNFLSLCALASTGTFTVQNAYISWAGA